MLKAKWAMVPALTVVCLASPASAENAGIKDAGEILRIAIPVTAAGISLYKEDYDGALQLTVSAAAAVAVSYGLSHTLKERRPDGSDKHSFPSDSTAMAFAGAAYLEKRYGWDYGLPAYALATFVGYSRVDAKKHHWWDAVAGAGIGWASSAIFTSKYYPNLTVTPAMGEGIGLRMDMRF